MRAKRRFMGQVCAVLSIASAVLCGMTLTHSYSIMPGDTAYLAECGSLRVMALTPGLAFTTIPHEFRAITNNFSFDPLPGFSMSSAVTQVSIPLYLPAGVFGVIAWRLLARRVRRTDVCEKCRYSMAGLPEGSRCPECGKRAEWAHSDALVTARA